MSLWRWRRGVFCRIVQGKIWCSICACLRWCHQQRDEVGGLLGLVNRITTTITAAGKSKDQRRGKLDLNGCTYRTRPQSDIETSTATSALLSRSRPRSPLSLSLSVLAMSKSTTTKSKRQNEGPATTTTTSSATKKQKPLVTDLPIHFFSSAEDFEEFLDREHLTSKGIHVKMARKSSGIPSINHDQLIEVALCFGWIDGQGNPYPPETDKYHLTRVTPRQKGSKSLWSKRNVGIVERFIAEDEADDARADAGEERKRKKKRMRDAGMRVINEAKADGRWERAYSGPAGIQVPPDFEAALSFSSPSSSSSPLDEIEAQEKAKLANSAKLFFDKLNRSDRYLVLLRLETCAPHLRQKRINALVDMLAVGKVPGKKTVMPVTTKTTTTTTTKGKEKGKESKVVKSRVVKKKKRGKSEDSEATTTSSTSDVEIESTTPAAAIETTTEKRRSLRGGLRNSATTV